MGFMIVVSVFDTAVLDTSVFEQEQIKRILKNMISIAVDFFI